MKVIYVGQDTRKRNSLLETEADVITLTGTNWDDFDYKTTFKSYSKIASGSVSLGETKILFPNILVSHVYLDELVELGWDGIFPIPDISYISTPAALSFYEQIDSRLSLETAISVARLLGDASYLSRIAEDDAALQLCKTTGFRMSLQREQGARKAFADGWKLFGKKDISIGNQSFRFMNAKGELQELNLTFSSTKPLPHEINVLIGPNGVGKSQVLHQIVDDWLQLDPSVESNIGFVTRPNFNQVVLVSYSPFEHFPVDTQDDKNRKDHDVYRYFGLRGRKRVLNDSRRGSENIIVSEEFPKANSAQSLVECLAFDQKYGAMSDWSRKLATMETVLKTAFDFDEAAVAVRDVADKEDFFQGKAFGRTARIIEINTVSTEGETREESYIPISSDLADDLKASELRKRIHDRSGVIFLKDGVPIHLSSGQQLFAYLVINILGAIRRNTLIIIDEPELFLHPTLEISFIKMLKEILRSYASKALLATHSLVTVREVPSESVHVFENTKDGIFVKHPPFETFGGDVQRISSYVFGDKSVSKPHETWVRQMILKYGSGREFIKALGKDINEELIVQINAMEIGKW